MAFEFKSLLPTVWRNRFYPGVSGSGVPNETSDMSPQIINDGKNLNKYRAPYQLVRIKVDTSFWRAGIAEAERPLSSLPFRVKMQQMLVDTVLNAHVKACMRKRKNLTLLKKFMICDENGAEDEAATKLLQTEWFHKMRNYIADAKFYGYSLITFGDMINDVLPNVEVVPRWLVSPDRLNMVSLPYIPTGINFMNVNETAPNGVNVYDWSLYVSSVSENGVSKCGYGLLYEVALYEIILRSLIGWNTDYTERFGQPTVVIKIVDTNNEGERGKAEDAAANMGSSGYIILDKNDDYELKSDTGAGTGWQSYANLEERCEKKISKLLLGHADAIDTKATALGGGAGGKKAVDEDSTPEGKALAECESIDSQEEEFIINNYLIPKLIKLGIKIPVGKVYKLKNDQEEYVEEKREAATALDWATVAQTMKQGGLEMSEQDFTDKTGIIATKVVVPPPAEPFQKFNNKVKAKLESIYK